MQTMTVAEAIKDGFLVEWDRDPDGDEYVSYEEKKGVNISYKGDAINVVEVYKEGNCNISIPIGRDRVDEHMVKTTAKLKINS